LPSTERQDPLLIGSTRHTLSRSAQNQLEPAISAFVRYVVALTKRANSALVTS
jgi:hypothetical protein